MDTLSQEQCVDLFTAEHVAHIGVVTGTGPYVTPISYVMLDRRLVFRSAPGRRTEAIEADPRVSVEVSRYDAETGNWSSAIASGSARVVRDDRELEERVVAGLMDKYRQAYGSLLEMPAEMTGGTRFIVLVDIGEMSGRSSGGYLHPGTRPGRM